MNQARTRLRILTATMVSATALMITPWSPLAAQTLTTEVETLEEQAAPGDLMPTGQEEGANSAESGEPLDAADPETSAADGDAPAGEEAPAEDAAAFSSTGEEAAVATEGEAETGNEASTSAATAEPATEDAIAPPDEEVTTTGEAKTEADAVDEVEPEAVISDDEPLVGSEVESSAQADGSDVPVQDAPEDEAVDGGEEDDQTVETIPEPEADVDAAPEVSPEAEEAAAALLADDTPAEELGDEELRERIAAYRALLEEPQLSAETSDSLRVRLKTDRDALRVRVAEAEAASAEVAARAATSEDDGTADETAASVTDDDDDGGDNTKKALILGGLAAAAVALPLLLLPDEQETTQIVSQPQPQRLEDLSDAELGRRMLALQQASEDEVNYTFAQRKSFENELEVSREELRRRLQRDREEREIYYLDSDPYDVAMNYVSPQQDYKSAVWAAEVDQQQIWRQLLAVPRDDLPQSQYSRRELRQNIEWIITRPGVRAALPGIELDTITFGFNEDFLREEELYDLDRIALLIEQVVVAHPEEIFLIEGHTDAVGNQEYNWRLSQRRAEAVKELITRYYLVPPENLVTAGLGEAYLKIWTPQAEAENRRVTLRRITPLVEGYAYR